MPIPRLQVVGGRHEPFVYRISWDTTIRAADMAQTDFDRRLHLVGMVGEYLVQLAGLLRPLTESKWLGLVARFNAEAIDDPGLDSFLFDASRVSTVRLRTDLRELQDARCFYCDGAIRSGGEVDHFLPWARWPDNGIENLVYAHAGCNRDKRDFMAAGIRLGRWSHRFAPAGPLSVQLVEIAERASWDRHNERTFGVARALHLRLPDEAELWLRGGEFVRPEWGRSVGRWGPTR